MTFLLTCALAHIDISPVLLPLLQRTINLSIRLSTTHLLKENHNTGLRVTMQLKQGTISQTNVPTIQKSGQALLFTCPQQHSVTQILIQPIFVE